MPVDPKKLEALAGKKRTDEELERLKSPPVSYMEIKAAAGGFSCGTCVFAGPGERCTHPKVDAPVSAVHGCCNLWAGDGVTFPPGYKLPKN